jgi:hypothetical protein
VSSREDIDLGIPHHPKQPFIIRADCIHKTMVPLNPFPQAEPIYWHHSGVEIFVDSSGFWDFPIHQ